MTDTSTNLAQALREDVDRLVKLADDIGRSRGSNNYAHNTRAVVALVKLQEKVNRSIEALAHEAEKQAGPVAQEMSLELKLRVLADHIKRNNGLRDNAAKDHRTLIEAADALAAPPSPLAEQDKVDAELQRSDFESWYHKSCNKAPLPDWIERLQTYSSYYVSGLWEAFKGGRVYRKGNA